MCHQTAKVNFVVNSYWGKIKLRTKHHHLLLFALLAASTPLRADEVCRSIKDSVARLACYDGLDAKASAATKATPSAGADGSASSKVDAGETNAPTKEVVAAKPSDPVKRIDADDLAIAPNKYVGKYVELTKAQCYYADKDEYRCLGNSSSVILMLVGAAITPAIEKQRLEDDCGEIKRMATPTCRRTIRIRPENFDHDTVSMRDRTVVSSQTFEVLMPESRRR